MEFEYGYDIDVLTNDVRDKLDMVSSELPDEVNTPIIFKFSTDMIPILLFAPCLLISLIILSFNLFGDGLRDAFDPKLKN